MTTFTRTQPRVQFDADNEMYTAIVGSHFTLRLERRDPAGIDARALIEALRVAVPVASDQDIIEALRREGARMITEATILERYLDQHAD
jgi:hypothetical protein